MRPTVKDVAALASVSPKTVSNVMNGIVYVRPETRSRVEHAIAQLGYVPNLSARGLRNGRSGVIALAMPDLSTPYSAEMAHHFVEVAHEQGWGVQFEETAVEPGRAWDLVSRARAHLVDGVILNPIRLEESIVTGSGVLPPLVMIGDVQQNAVDQVWVDSFAAARDMTRHLIGLGHRRISVVGVIGGRFDTATARLRQEGYHSALAEAGIARDPSIELSCEAWTPRSAAERVSSFLTHHDPPDAFFCFTDSMAIGTLSALWSAGLSARRAVSVAGFDDIADGQFATPPLTTVTFNKRYFAEQTLELLVKRMSTPDAPPVRVAIPHAIEARASTTAR
ncbi:MAG: transcriptional regulator, LacI family [Microbacteriaceae bacterium]|jgi:DNA-binding LacI/PurR family transcriptional regulator|nr:transcriptional regulator, LacI family [Microbacteriaceae bacterium]HEV7955827.1 LacI family DNA-binding transcriptional regulator [Marisediminicola sp.]